MEKRVGIIAMLRVPSVRMKPQEAYAMTTFTRPRHVFCVEMTIDVAK